MNEKDLQKKDKEFEKLLCSCDKLSSQMFDEKKKCEYLELEILSQKMREIRREIWLVQNLLDFWDKVRGLSLENDFLSFANRYFKYLDLDLNIEISYSKIQKNDDFRFMDIYFGWGNICRFYDDYYTRKIILAQNKST